jgi:hypothetical protein
MGSMKGPFVCFVAGARFAPIVNGLNRCWLEKRAVEALDASVALGATARNYSVKILTGSFQGAASTGGRNTLVKSFGWCSEV